MLNNLYIKSVYSTDSDDIANEFYIPLLSEAISYKRVSGYFSSAALSLFSKGIEELAYNNGTYKLLISNQISEEDYELIKEGYLNREKITNKIETELSDYSELSLRQRKDFANLAYLIEIQVMDIKIGFTKEGIFHSKYGIITDEGKNKVYFSGSLNETRAAFIQNYESITVVKNWSSKDDYDTLENQDKHFNMLWNGESDSIVYVKDFNEILKSSILQYSKGKIIMDPSLMAENSLILYVEENVLKIENNLIIGDSIESERRIKKIQALYLEDGIFWRFYENLSYKDIEDIINRLNQFGEKRNQNIVISDTVYNFINSKKFEIDEISKRGTLIKNKDISIIESFDQFNQIMSGEVVRNLRPMQAWVSYYMSMMVRAGNFSVPGSGKTAMVYGAFAYLSSSKIDQVDKIVMIGPKSAFKSWKDEFEFVFQHKKKLEVLDIHSEDFHQSMLSKNLSNYNLILINYESMIKYKEELKKIINSRTMLVFDEVHKIKKIDGARAAVALDLAQLAKYRYVLSGTPIPNGYQDLWNLLHVMYNDEYNDFFGFTKYSLQNMDLISAETLNEQLFPFYWRVTKNDLGVPPVNEDNKKSVKANNTEQKIIDLLWRKYGHNPFVLYTRLIQCSSNPALLKYDLNESLFEDSYGYIDEDEVSNKFIYEYFDEMDDKPKYTQDELKLIESVSVTSKFKSAIKKADSLVEEDKTVLIWCIFVDTMDKVVKELTEKGHRVALIYGAVKASEREQIITDFQNGEYDILVTNPHTLAESVSLHNICHDAIYLEFSFNLTHMLQSRDRIHRLGLKDTDETNYYYYFLEGNEGMRSTIDEKIYIRLKEKEAIMINSIEGTQIGVEFTLDEKNEIIEMMREEQKRYNINSIKQ